MILNPTQFICFFHRNSEIRSAENKNNQFWAAQNNPRVDSLFGRRIVMLVLSVLDTGRKKIGPFVEACKSPILGKEKHPKQKTLDSFIFCQMFVVWLDTWICVCVRWFLTVFPMVNHHFCTTISENIFWILSQPPEQANLSSYCRSAGWPPETWSRLPDILIDGWLNHLP